MKWQDVREQFPDRCVLVESLDAVTEENERFIREMVVIDDFESGNDAWHAYRKFHQEDRTRELYIFHTKKADIKVYEQPYLTVR